jgi:hypothetical protein
MNTNHPRTLLALHTILCMPSIAVAQETWQLSYSLSVTTGNYVGSQTMNNQDSLGMRVLGEKDHTLGFAADLRSTRISMTPITQVSTQNQDNWMLSGFRHVPSSHLPGRWTFQLDTHQIHNDALQSDSSDVRAFAPQITWLSYSQPLKVDISYANSSYKNTATIHQYSSAIAYALNGDNDWLQIRSYAINHLDPTKALGQTSTYATDIKLTHFFSTGIHWAPCTLTLGVERGKRIYVVDMATQTVYNLPMRNEGGENIAATWLLNSKTNLNLQFNKTKYLSNIPFTHNFTLSTLSAQIVTAW